MELTARGKSDEGNKEDLQKRLSELLGGTTRLPALLHSNENFDVSVKELNIESYEVLFFEALHCSMNHIKNVLQELPHHITDIDTLIKLKEILAVQMTLITYLPQDTYLHHQCSVPICKLRGEIVLGDSL